MAVAVVDAKDAVAAAAEDGVSRSETALLDATVSEQTLEELLVHDSVEAVQYDESNAADAKGLTKVEVTLRRSVTSSSTNVAPSVS